MKKQMNNETMPVIRPVAVLSSTVLPIDGTYDVTTVSLAMVDIKDVPHYIGHPTTKTIVEGFGAVPAETKLFKGLEPGEAAVCFSIKQGRSNRAKDGFTSPHQEVEEYDLDVRVIRRLNVWADQGTGDVIVTSDNERFVDLINKKGKPACYTPNDDTYPLCRGRGTKDKLCKQCALYEDMEGY